jgi:hypothetical protein
MTPVKHFILVLLSQLELYLGFQFPIAPKPWRFVQIWTNKHCTRSIESGETSQNRIGQGDKVHRRPEVKGA